MTTTTKELCYLSITEAGALMRSRKLSPVELVRAHLERIEAVDGMLHSFVTVMPDQAMSEARKAEAELLRGHDRGPLHGIPTAHKDLYDTAGVRTTSGSRVDMDRVPAEDCTVVARYRDAGAVLLGKLAMHEFALGGPDFTTPFPPARNPWNTGHITGGSSSGSGAAVAGGLCMGALGSCTGGSIRFPASHCGTVGIKPTYGRVSRAGVVTLSWSQDHAGPLTRRVEDAALMLQPIAGHDPKDPTSSRAPVPDYREGISGGIEGLRIGVPRDYFFSRGPNVSSEVLDIVEKQLEVLEELGARVEDVSIPSLDFARSANMVIMLSEAFAYHEPNLKARAHEYGELQRASFRIGGLLKASDYVQAQRCRSVVKKEFADVLQRVDVLVSPTMPRTAPAFEGYDPVGHNRGPSYTAPYNVTGLPAISVPAGFDGDRLPVGLQIGGRPFDEATLFRVAYAYEQRTRWYAHRPSI